MQRRGRMGIPYARIESILDLSRWRNSTTGRAMKAVSMIAGDGSIHAEAAGKAPVAEGVGGCGVWEDGSSRSCRWSLGGDDGVGVWTDAARPAQAVSIPVPLVTCRPSLFAAIIPSPPRVGHLQNPPTRPSLALLETRLFPESHLQLRISPALLRITPPPSPRNPL